MHTLKQWILLLLLIPVFAFSQTAMDSNHYLVFKYNYPPDSLFVDGKPVEMIRQNMRYRVAESGSYHVRAVLKGALPFEQKAIFVNSRFSYVNIRFAIDDAFVDVDKTTAYAILPTYSFFSKSNILVKSFRNVWGVTNAISAGVLLQYSLSSDKFSGKKQLPILLSGVAQQVYYAARIYFGTDDNGLFKHPGYASTAGVGLFATYTVLDIDDVIFSKYEALEIKEVVSLTHQRFRRTTIKGIDSEIAMPTIGLEGHLTNDLSVTAALSFKTMQVNMSIEDTVKYGSGFITEIPQSERVNSEFKFMFTRLSLNYRFLRMLNQEWIVNVGGFWSSSLDMEKDYRVKLYSNQEFYEDATANFSYSAGGIIYGIRMMTPISKRLNFFFNYNKINSVDGELNTIKFSSQADVWQSGLRYEFF